MQVQGSRLAIREGPCGLDLRGLNETQPEHPGLQGYGVLGLWGFPRICDSGFSVWLQGSKSGCQLARWSSDPAFRSLNPRANGQAAPTLRKAIRALRSFWSPGNILSSRLSSKLGGGSASTTAGQDQGTWTLGVRTSGYTARMHQRQQGVLTKHLAGSCQAIGLMSPAAVCGSLSATCAAVCTELCMHHCCCVSSLLGYSSMLERP